MMSAQERADLLTSAIAGAIESYVAGDLDSINYHLTSPHLGEDVVLQMVAERRILERIAQDAPRIGEYVLTHAGVRAWLGLDFP